jgi:nucleotide sugar dehydrogenase
MKIGIIGVGKLGLCLALNLDKAGHQIYACDTDAKLVEAIRTKALHTAEPMVESYLADSRLIIGDDLSHIAEADVIFIVLPTPSLPDGSYDHTLITQALRDIRALGLRDKVIAINSTVMPGYCATVLNLVDHNHLIYNPEFIAQGSIIRDQQNQDVVLIGGTDTRSMSIIAELHRSICLNKPSVKMMSFAEAEITKLATNVFLTMKIAYANKVGDMVSRYKGNPDVVLNAIGDDRRINHHCLKYGFGYGGPCLPRDNKAYIKASEDVKISAELNVAIDQANDSHLMFMVDEAKDQTSIVMDRVTFKDESTILDNSQRLAFANAIAAKGTKVTIVERQQVIDQLRKMYGWKFEYALEK